MVSVERLEKDIQDCLTILAMPDLNPEIAEFISNFKHA